MDIIEIFPTLQCNLHCRYCDRGKEDSVLEDFNEIKILHNNLKKDPSFRLLNFRISGGEPTLYSRVNELISFLHGINSRVKIEFFTNAIGLDKLTAQSLARINLVLSIYPSTEKILKRDRYLKGLLGSWGIRIKTNTLFHEDMESYGTVRNDLDPVFRCFIVTLVCGTKRVYPCCRAHRLEQMYRKRYHLYIDTPDLYKKLMNIIKNTDLCTHCPRMYDDGARISLKKALDRSRT